MLFAFDDLYHPNAQAVAVNQSLSDNAAPHRLDEPFLIERFEALMAYPPSNGELFWLTLARINELALFCAGNYADSGEIQAAGSLLVNPRQVLVHIQGRPDPVLKQRDQRLSDQFQDYARGRDVKDWLKEQTKLEVVQPPLLPQLMGFMVKSGRFRKDYLESVTTRACRISDTINLVSSCSRVEDTDFTLYLSMCQPEDRDFLEAGLCRFDLHLFWELGREVQAVLCSNVSPGHFLKKARESSACIQDFPAMEAMAATAWSTS